MKLIKIHALQFGNVYRARKNYSSNNVILIFVYICVKHVPCTKKTWQICKVQIFPAPRSIQNRQKSEKKNSLFYPSTSNLILIRHSDFIMITQAAYHYSIACSYIYQTNIVTCAENDVHMPILFSLVLFLNFLPDLNCKLCCFTIHPKVTENNYQIRVL